MFNDTAASAANAFLVIEGVVVVAVGGEREREAAVSGGFLDWSPAAAAASAAAQFLRCHRCVDSDSCLSSGLRFSHSPSYNPYRTATGD